MHIPHMSCSRSLTTVSLSQFSIHSLLHVLLSLPTPNIRRIASLHIDIASKCINNNNNSYTSVSYINNFCLEQIYTPMFDLYKVCQHSQETHMYFIVDLFFLLPFFSHRNVRWCWAITSTRSIQGGKS